MEPNGPDPNAHTRVHRFARRPVQQSHSGGSRMKALIPYAILGAIGTAGAVVGVSGATSSATDPVAPVTTPLATPAVNKNGPVIVHAALDRTALPANGGD